MSALLSFHLLIYVGVVEAMPLVVDTISKLHEAGATYSVDQDMYFRVKQILITVLAHI
jgi:L-cysteine:1D-myo-inositol 2-amino-2-deoxy-alpha-D-glucopyranoside ligase